MVLVFAHPEAHHLAYQVDRHGLVVRELDGSPCLSQGPRGQRRTPRGYWE